MSQNIIFMPRGYVQPFDISSSTTQEGVTIISSDILEVTGEDVGIIGNRVPTETRLVKRKPPVSRVNPTDRSCTEVNYLLPWSEMGEQGEDCRKYMRRHINSKPVILIYSVFIATIVLFAALRYRRDDYFWLIFSMGVFWWLFGALSIWYATLHQDMYIGMILAIIFIGLMITFGYVALETRHLDIEIILI
jgi:hypothetical protein